MQVYLPDDLYNVVKSQCLSASRLLQEAVRSHCQRQEKIAEAHRHVQEIYAELGPPTAEDIECAENKAREIADALRGGEQAAAASRSSSPTT